MSTSVSSAKLGLKQVVLEIFLPPCHPYSMLRLAQQLTRRQLKQFQSDTLSVFVLSNPPRLALIAMPRTHDRMFLFADDPHVADACARQFYEDALIRLQTLEPSIKLPGEADRDDAGSYSLPFKTISVVAKCNAVAIGVPRVVDLMELEGYINAQYDNRTTCAIFDPEEYPGLIWLDTAESEEAKMEGPDVFGSLANNKGDCQMKTIVFPSGAIVVHGASMDKMEEAVRSKLPLIHRCLREKPAMATLVVPSIAK